MKKSLVLGVLVLMALGILVSLGNWQVERMAWKNALLEKLATAASSKAIGFPAWLDKQKQMADSSSNKHFKFQEFDFVAVSGKFRHDQEVYVYGSRQGKPGHRVFTPLVFSKPIRGMNIVMINRGFVSGQVPTQNSDKIARPSGLVRVSGFSRANEFGRFFTPEPDHQKRKWYSNNSAAMARHLGYRPRDHPHFYIEADATPNAGGWPIGRDPKKLLATIPNNHLGYVITWYGLALALLGVYGFFLYGNRRQSTGE